MHNCIKFNQDATCFGCAGDNGFVVYNSDPIMVRFTNLTDDSSNSIQYLALLYKTNIIAFVKKEQPNVLCLWNDQKNEICAEIMFKDDIITGVKLTKDYIIICTIRETFLYSFKDMTVLFKTETVPNVNGVIDLCSEPNLTFVYLSDTPGQIVVGHLNTEARTVISAHSNSISGVCLNKEGTLVATVSERGTLVRIWNTQSGEMVKELRRGLDTAEITSMCFNKDSTQLLICSSKGTMHIFYLSQTNRKSSLSYFESILPTYFSSEWSSISIQVEPKSICHFSYSEDNLVYVIDHNASIFKKYQINTQDNTCLLLSNDEFYKQK